MSNLNYQKAAERGKFNQMKREGKLEDLANQYLKPKRKNTKKNKRKHAKGKQMNDKIAVELAKEIEVLNKHMASQASKLADITFIVERLDEMFVARDDMEQIAVKLNNRFNKILERLDALEKRG